jgi:hypothetical protein
VEELLSEPTDSCFSYGYGAREDKSSEEWDYLLEVMVKFEPGSERAAVSVSEDYSAFKAPVNNLAARTGEHFRSSVTQYAR